MMINLVDTDIKTAIINRLNLLKNGTWGYDRERHKWHRKDPNETSGDEKCNIWNEKHWVGLIVDHTLDVFKARLDGTKEQVGKPEDTEIKIVQNRAYNNKQ